MSFNTILGFIGSATDEMIAAKASLNGELKAGKCRWGYTLDGMLVGFPGGAWLLIRLDSLEAIEKGRTDARLLLAPSQGGVQ